MKTKIGRSPPTDPIAHSRAQIAPRLYRDAPIREIIQFILNNQLNQKIMKTTVIESGKNSVKAVKTNDNNGTIAKTGNANGSPQTASNGKTGSEPKKGESPAPVTAQPKPQTEPTKAELKQVLITQKPTLNLEGTLKLVEEMHRRKIQRDKLLDTIDTLETFEVAQKDDAEETDSNHFQGCQLTIEDDQRREFTAKNPFIIKKVAEYINALCLDRLAEIEGEIFLPNFS